MNKIEVDLTTCKPGDKLLTVHGLVLEYVEYKPENTYPHLVKYPHEPPYNGSLGSRLDNGWVFGKKRTEEDEDIVEILS